MAVSFPTQALLHMTSHATSSQVNTKHHTERNNKTQKQQTWTKTFSNNFQQNMLRVTASKTHITMANSMHNDYGSHSWIVAVKALASICRMFSAFLTSMKSAIALFYTVNKCIFDFKNSNYIRSINHKQSEGGTKAADHEKCSPRLWN